MPVGSSSKHSWNVSLDPYLHHPHLGHGYQCPSLVFTWSPASWLVHPPPILPRGTSIVVLTCNSAPITYFLKTLQWLPQLTSHVSQLLYYLVPADPTYFT